MVKITEKYSAPTKLDFAEQGSLIKSITDDGTHIYIQVHKDEERPQWINLGHFFEKALSDLISKKDFMSECMKRYESHETFAYKLWPR
jgi:hypothetical protein